MALENIYKSDDSILSTLDFAARSAPSRVIQVWTPTHPLSAEATAELELEMSVTYRILKIKFSLLII
jgi:hypothetical protein